MKPTIQHLWIPGLDETWCGVVADQWAAATPEESLAVPVCAKCHRRMAHWAMDGRDDARAKLKYLQAAVRLALGTTVTTGPSPVLEALEELI